MKVTVDYYAFAKVALDEAKPFLAKIRDEGTPAALDILERWERLERDVESTGAAMLCISVRNVRAISNR